MSEWYMIANIVVYGLLFTAWDKDSILNLIIKIILLVMFVYSIIFYLT